MDFLLGILYTFTIFISTPAIAYWAYNGFTVDKFRNWRLARTLTVVMLSLLGGMFLILRTYETLSTVGGLFTLFSAVLFTLPMSLYAEAWMSHETIKSLRARHQNNSQEKTYVA